MWAFTRIAEFHRAYLSSQPDRDSPPFVELPFAEGFLNALLLVTPFWMCVGYLLHFLA